MNERISSFNDQYENLVEQRDRKAAQLKQLENNEIKWTDHGLVRYLDRVRKTPIDAEAMLAEVLTDDLQDLIDKLGGNGKFPCGEYSWMPKTGIHAMQPCRFCEGQESQWRKED